MRHRCCSASLASCSRSRSARRAPDHARHDLVAGRPARAAGRSHRLRDERERTTTETTTAAPRLPKRRPDDPRGADEHGGRLRGDGAGPRRRRWTTTEDVTSAPVATDTQREKRRLILRAAITVFARSGYHTSRVSDVAKEAGVAYGLVYHYFGSKEDLLETIFRRTWSRMLEAVEAIERRGCRRASSLPLSRESCSARGSSIPTSSACSSARWRGARSSDVRWMRSSTRSRRSSASSGSGQERGELRARARPALRRLDPLRRARGDPHRLGLRAAAGGT